MNERFESGYLPASHKILWVVLRVGLLAWGTYGLFHGSVVEFLEAIFAIIFTHLWDFFSDIRRLLLHNESGLFISNNAEFVYIYRRCCGLYA